MLVTNKHILPTLFLGPQVVHVLDYTFKWKMADIANKKNGIECGTWDEILDNFPRENGGGDLVDLINMVMEIRSMEDEINLIELEDICRMAIGLWPTLVKLEQKWK